MTPVAGGDKPFVDHFIVDLKATYLPTVGYYSMAWQQRNGFEHDPRYQEGRGEVQQQRIDRTL